MIGGNIRHDIVDLLTALAASKAIVKHAFPIIDPVSILILAIARTNPIPSAIKITKLTLRISIEISPQTPAGRLAYKSRKVQ